MPEKANGLDPKKVQEFMELQERVKKLQRELKAVKTKHAKLEAELIEEMEGIGQTIMDIGEVVVTITTAKKVAVQYGKLFDLALTKVNEKIRNFLLEAKETLTTVRLVKHIEVVKKSFYTRALANRIAFQMSRTAGVKELWSEFKARLKAFATMRRALEKWLEVLRDILTKIRTGETEA